MTLSRMVAHVGTLDLKVRLAGLYLIGWAIPVVHRLPEPWRQRVSARLLLWNAWLGEDDD